MDYGSKYAEKRERIIDIRLQKLFRQARKELTEKLEEYTKKYVKKADELRKKAKKGTAEERKKAEQEYKDWLKTQTFIGKQWKDKVDVVTDMLASTNEKALTMIRGEQLKVFAENANYGGFMVEKAVEGEDIKGSVSFSIYDEATVERLVDKKPDLLPKRKVNKRKDKSWNGGIISNCIAQGIIQGESIEDIAKRISHDTANNDMKAMVRYARTAMTSAQNAGRMDTLHWAKDEGIKVQKQWLATMDRRTRDSHRKLDGDIKEVDEPFDGELSKIMFPGDPEADPGEVYNCRCTLIYHYPGLSKNENWRENETVDGMTYEEWKENKRKIKRIRNLSDVEEENDMLAIQAIADEFGIKEDVRNRHVMARVADAFINNYGLPLPPSNWSGKTIIKENKTDLKGANSLFDADTGDIYAWKGADFLDEVHEQLHARSRGMTSEIYAKNWAIEEACVETLTQKMTESIPITKSIATEDKVIALGHVAKYLNKEPYELAVELIDIPLDQRYDKLNDMFEEEHRIKKESLQKYSVNRTMLLELKGTK